MRSKLLKIWREVRGWWGGFAILGFWLATHFIGKDIEEKFTKERRFTVGVVYKTHWMGKTGRAADATFEVDGETYYAEAPLNNRLPGDVVGRRYLVVYHPPDPGRYNSLQLDEPIPGTLTDVPPNGWAEPPLSQPQTTPEP